MEDVHKVLFQVLERFEIQRLGFSSRTMKEYIRERKKIPSLLGTFLKREENQYQATYVFPPETSNSTLREYYDYFDASRQEYSYILGQDYSKPDMNIGDMSHTFHLVFDGDSKIANVLTSCGIELNYLYLPDYS